MIGNAAKLTSASSKISASSVNNGRANNGTAPRAQTVAGTTKLFQTCFTNNARIASR